jgi:hypothetical protein
MKSRSVFISLLFIFCVGLLCAVGMQRRELINLKAERQRKLTEDTPLDAPVNIPVQAIISALPASRELLQLRNELGQLRRRRKELESARAEHEQLLKEIAARGTNTFNLSSNYIRKSEARLVGYNSPEETLQSFLYSLRNRDLSNLFQAFTPQSISPLKLQATEHPEDFQKTLEQEARGLIGMRIISQEQQQADVISANVEMLPGLPPTQMFFRLVNGQWKMDSLP